LVLAALELLASLEELLTHSLQLDTEALDFTEDSQTEGTREETETKSSYIAI
jgi:hypothetical protein